MQEHPNCAFLRCLSLGLTLGLTLGTPDSLIQDKRGAGDCAKGAALPATAYSRRKAAASGRAGLTGNV
jgi:hypothetical protein